MIDRPNLLIANPNVQEDLDTEQEEKLEPMWRVLIHNDDVTTFEFVIRVLQSIFDRDVMSAEQIAFTAHQNGNAYVASYQKSEAEKRVNRGRAAAMMEGFPLQFSMEPEE